MYYNEQSVEDVARVVGIPEAAVKTRMRPETGERLGSAWPECAAKLFNINDIRRLLATQEWRVLFNRVAVLHAKHTLPNPKGASARIIFA